MIAMTGEFAMSRAYLDDDYLFLHTRDGRLEDQGACGQARCHLEIAGVRLPIDVPVELLRDARGAAPSEIVLRVPVEEPRLVKKAPQLSRRQEESARLWMADMEDCDRF